MSIIDDDPKPGRILDSMNLDECKLIDLPTEKISDLLHEHIGVGIVGAGTQHASWIRKTHGHVLSFICIFPPVIFWIVSYLHVVRNSQ